jgi:protein involved in polysaccharide export with SLBB domain
MADVVPYVPGEFERFVQRQAGPDVEVRRLGAEIVTGGTDSTAEEAAQLVPDDHVVSPGDEVLITIWGSVDADLRLTVDRAGRIAIPRVGAVQVAGLRQAELRDVITRRVALVFRNFELSVSLGRLRGIRVFVTGQVLRPGAYHVSSLATVVTALMRAGGPSAAGTFRRIEIRRGPALLTEFDLYDLLARGDRGSDRTLQAGDVVHVGPVGAQVAVIGSVNRPAVIELRPRETVEDALRLAGGFGAVADRSRLAIERLEDRSAGRVAQIGWPDSKDLPLNAGDVIRVFSAVDAVLPTQRQSKRVRVEGEVLRPGEYVLPATSSIGDAIRAAGGLTGAAFVFATEFHRESVRQSQQENYERALRDLETELARAGSSQRVSSADEAASRQATIAAQGRLIERLRALRPTGRVVLQLPPDGGELPDLALEDGDRLYVPARPTTIGVFGSVFNAAAYLHSPGRTLDDYLRLAGGPTKGADRDSVFVVRANGHVLSNRQESGFFRGSRLVENTVALPGDTIFVPENLDRTSFLQLAKDWTTILYQFGLGAAGLKVLTN